MKLKTSMRSLVVASIGLTQAASAQTVTITNGVQKYASLASTVVNMGGKCELWVTNSSPLSGCVVNLNSRTGLSPDIIQNSLPLPLSDPPSRI